MPGPLPIQSHSFVALLKGDKNPYSFVRQRWNVVKGEYEAYGPHEGFAREVNGMVMMGGRRVIIHVIDGQNFFQA